MNLNERALLRLTILNTGKEVFSSVPFTSNVPTPNPEPNIPKFSQFSNILLLILKIFSHTYVCVYTNIHMYVFIFLSSLTFFNTSIWVLLFAFFTESWLEIPKTETIREKRNVAELRLVSFPQTWLKTKKFAIISSLFLTIILCQLWNYQSRLISHFPEELHVQYLNRLYLRWQGINSNFIWLWRNCVCFGIDLGENSFNIDVLILSVFHVID